MTTFQLESLSYQTDAVEAVVKVFEGTQPTKTSNFSGNRCTLTWLQLQSNLKAIAQRQQISDERLQLTQPSQGQPLDICVEMETGTGNPNRVWAYVPDSMRKLIHLPRSKVKCTWT